VGAIGYEAVVGEVVFGVGGGGAFFASLGVRFGVRCRGGCEVWGWGGRVPRVGSSLDFLVPRGIVRVVGVGELERRQGRNVVGGRGWCWW